jgi:hypothetical protein
VQRAALAHGLEPDQVFANAYWGVEKPMPIAASLTDWLARAASGVADSVQEHDALARRMR